jgi:hypothetical protein
MALFGDFGKAFQAAVAPIVVPTKAIIGLAQGKSFQEVKQGVNRELAPYQGAARGLLAVAGVRSGGNTIDAPQQGPGPQQMNEQFQTQYFQPTQFAGGSYDPNLGGGYPSWDYSIGSPMPQTPYWGATVEDWAQDW